MTPSPISDRAFTQYLARYSLEVSMEQAEAGIANDTVSDATARPVELHVSEEGLKEAFRLLARLVRHKGKGMAIISFKSGNVHFATPELDVHAPAEGHWPGQARISMGAMMAVVGRPPRQSPLCIRYDGGRIHLGPTFSCTCEWSAGADPLIRLPINYDDGTLIALSLRYSQAEIETSGLLPLVKQAEKRLGGRLKTATQALAQYHVTPERLRATINQALKECGVLDQIGKV